MTSWAEYSRTGFVYVWYLDVKNRWPVPFRHWPLHYSITRQTSRMGTQKPTAGLHAIRRPPFRIEHVNYSGQDCRPLWHSRKGNLLQSHSNHSGWYLPHRLAGSPQTALQIMTHVWSFSGRRLILINCVGIPSSGVLCQCVPMMFALMDIYWMIYP